MTAIALLGLGNMGRPMAVNLLAAGHRVVGFDPDPAAAERARAAGVSIADSGEAAVSGAEVVITMFQTGRQVLDAYPALLAAAPAGALFADCSTVSVVDARAAHALAAAAGFRAVDAPVSGGVVGAEAGTLTFMVGGEPADVEAVRPVLAAMGGRIVHCGDAGAGQAAKVCNNLILGASMIAVSEAFVLGERLGLSHDALFEVAAHASGQCWALTVNCPVPGPVPASPANRDYAGGFAGALMHKDLGLAMDAVAATGASVRLGRVAAELYAEYAAGPGARRDFSGIIEDIRSQEDA